MSNTSITNEKVRTDTVLSNPKALQEFLNKAGKSAVELALPKHMSADRLLRVVLTSFSTTPKLRECTAHSILASTVLAAQIGLEPGVNGQAYLVPYGKTCTFVPGWQGLVGLLNNTGRATAWTGAVFEGDHFEFELGSSPKCRHIPGDNFGDPDLITWVYAVGKVNGSEQPIVEAWPISRVLKHRDKHNKVGARHYSYGNLEMYARKVVLLQVLKYLPRSIQVDNAITAVNASDSGRIATVEDGVVIDIDSAEVTGPSDAAEAVKEAAKAAPKESEPKRKKADDKAKSLLAEEKEPEPEKGEEEPPKPPTEEEQRAEIGNKINALLKENHIKGIVFENACRRAGLIQTTSNLQAESTAKLKIILEAAGPIIEAIIGEED